MGLIGGKRGDFKMNLKALVSKDLRKKIEPEVLTRHITSLCYITSNKYCQ